MENLAGDRLKASVDGTQEPESKQVLSFSMSSKPEKRKSSLEVTESEPATKKIGFGFNLNKKPAFTEEKDNGTKKPIAPIKMSLGIQKPKESQPVVKKTSALVAKAFNADEDSDEEEMPPECRMKMKNIGRDTPTAAGPNSFGKGKMGFCDRQKIIQREFQTPSEEDKRTKSSKK